MKTSARVWNFLKGNWDTLLIMGITLIIAPLGFLQRVDQQIVSTAILSILFLLAYNLLVTRETNQRLRQNTEDILERLGKPSAEEVLLAYKKWMDEIEANLGTAREVWVLSRTCVSFWQAYAPQLESVLARKGSIRLMLVNPNNGALKMIANSAKFTRARDIKNNSFPKVTAENQTNRLSNLRARVEEFIEFIADYKLQAHKGCLNLRTIDYLPSQTLVIINGDSEDGRMFVELGTFQANERNRPTFFLQKTRNKDLFSFYRNEYDVMWECAEQAEQLRKLEAINN